MSIRICFAALALVLALSGAAAAGTTGCTNATWPTDEVMADNATQPYMYGEVNATRPDFPQYTMGEAVTKALQDNPQIASAKSFIRGSEYGVNSARGSYFPTATGGYSYTYFGDEDAAFTLSRSDHQYRLYFTVDQPIFTGWRLDNQFDKAKLQMEEAEANLSNAELSLILSVQENFLRLLAAREDVRSAQDSVTRLESQLKVTDAFYDVGLKPRLDVLQARADLASAEDTLLQAQNAVATQQARLNTLLSLPIEAEVQYVGELCYAPFQMQLPRALTRAYLNRPDMWLARLAVDIADKDAGLARSELLPQVSASLDWFRIGEDPDVNGGNSIGNNFTGWEASINAAYELFDGGESRNSWLQAREGMQAQIENLQNTRQEVSFDVKSRLLDIEESTKRIKVARVGVASAQEGYRMAVARYQAQVGTNTDVLDAQSRLTTAEANLTSALADYQVSLARLYVAIGERNVQLLTQ